MRNAPIQLVLLAALAATIGTVSPAYASGCTVSSSGLNFGNYDVFSTLNNDVTGTIDVNCPSGTSYSLGLSSGSGTFYSRTLTNGSHVLGYNLFIDSTRLTIWGDGSSGTSTVSGSGTGSTIGTPVYGRVPAGQNAYIGSYSDVVTITVTF